MDDTRYREQVDAPELGASVFLVEGSVGDVMPLFDLAAEKGKNLELMMRCLAATLEIDGKRVTRAEIDGMGSRRMKALLRVGPRALYVMGISTEGEDEKKR